MINMLLKKCKIVWVLLVLMVPITFVQAKVQINPTFAAKSIATVSVLNNPDVEMLSDTELKQTQGAFWPYLAGAAVGGISGGISSGISSYADTGRVDWYSVASGTAGGAVGGLVSPVSAFSAIGRPIVSGALGGITSSAFNTYVKRW